MVYARVHDQTVADDYYAAMDRVEQRLFVRARGQIAPPAAAMEEHNEDEPLNDDERGQLLDLADQLAAADLSPEMRMDLVERIRQVLNHSGTPDEDEPPPIGQENGRRQRGPPGYPLGASPAFPWVLIVSHESQTLSNNY